MDKEFFIVRFIEDNETVKYFITNIKEKEDLTNNILYSEQELVKKIKDNKINTIFELNSGMKVKLLNKYIKEENKKKEKLHNKKLEKQINEKKIINAQNEIRWIGEFNNIKENNIEKDKLNYFSYYNKKNKDEETKHIKNLKYLNYDGMIEAEVYFLKSKFTKRIAEFINNRNKEFVICVVPKHIAYVANMGAIAKLADDISVKLNLKRASQVLQRTENTYAKHKSYKRKNVDYLTITIEESYRIKNKNVILLDDIITTGETMNICRKKLLEYGAKTVTCVGIAKTIKII